MTTLSQPVMVVENRSFGNRAYCTINEASARSCGSAATTTRCWTGCAWLRDGLGPAMGAALRDMGGLPLKGLVARGLTMGDELHQRNVACSSLALRALSRRLLASHGRRHRRACPKRWPSSARTISSSSTSPWPWARRSWTRSGISRDRQRGDRHEPQRHRFRHPRERHGRHLVHRACGDARGPLLPGLHRGRRQP